MPKDKTKVLEELNDIQKGINTRNFIDMLFGDNPEMARLSAKTAELKKAFEADDEQKRHDAMKEAYHASLYYEMMKRETNEADDWNPSSAAGKTKIKSARHLREFIEEYDPDIAQTAQSEFRQANKNHVYSATAMTLADRSQSAIDMQKLAPVLKQREQLHQQRTSLAAANKLVDRQQNELEQDILAFENDKRNNIKENHFQRLSDINKGLHKQRKGNLILHPSAELKNLNKKEVSLEKALKNSDGNINDPKVIEKMKEAYTASLEYELAKRKGNAQADWQSGISMRREHISAARDLRKYIAENYPELAQAANRDFLDRCKNSDTAKIVAGYTQNTIKNNMELKKAELADDRTELERKQNMLRREQSRQANIDYDEKNAKKFDDKLTEIEKGLNVRHKGGVAGRATTEMQSLRTANTELKKTLAEVNGNVNDPIVVEAMYNAYKESLRYETLKRENDTSHSWKPDTNMGKRRIESSRKLREFVIEHCPDAALRAANDFISESKGKKYAKTAEVLAKANREDINISLQSQKEKFECIQTDIDAMREELQAKQQYLKHEQKDFKLRQQQEQARQQHEFEEKERRQAAAKRREEMYTKKSMGSRFSNEMKQLIKANNELDLAVEAADGNVNDKNVEKAMEKAYRKSLEYELAKRKDNDKETWTPVTETGKTHINAARSLREYIEMHRPDVAKKTVESFVSDKYSRYSQTINVIAQNARHSIAAVQENLEDTEKTDYFDVMKKIGQSRREIADERKKSEQAVAESQKLRGEMNGYSEVQDPEKKKEFAKQREELNKQRMVIIKRETALDVREEEKKEETKIDQEIRNDIPLDENKIDNEEKKPEQEFIEVKANEQEKEIKLEEKNEAVPEKHEEHKKEPEQEEQKQNIPNKQNEIALDEKKVLYESVLAEERQEILSKLESFSEQKLHHENIKQEDYKKTVAEAMAIQKMSEQYKNGIMYENGFEMQKNSFAEEMQEHPNFNTMVSLRTPKQLLERMDNNESIQQEMEKTKYTPGINLDNFVKSYKDQKIYDMSKREFREMVLDTRKMLQKDIKQSADKGQEKEQIQGIFALTALNALNFKSSDPKESLQLKKQGKLNRLHCWNDNLENLMHHLKNDFSNQLEFQSMLKTHGTQKLTEMALKDDGRQLSAVMVGAKTTQKVSDEQKQPVELEEKKVIVNKTEKKLEKKLSNQN